MSRHFIISTALLASLAFSGAAKAADVHEFNFQSSYAGPHVLNLHLYQPWIEELKKRSDGRLVLHFFMSGAITKPEEAATAVMNGSVDISGISPTYSDTLFPNTLSFMVPHITRDSVQAAHLYWKAYTTLPEVKAEFDKIGKTLAIWGSDRSGLFSNKGPIASPADLKGKRVLIWSGGQVDQVKSWGGIPVQVSPNDTYMGMQRGMGDVFYGPLPIGVAYKLMEVTKDVTVIPASTIFVGISMNWDAWKSLPPDLQKLMEETTGEQFSYRSGDLLYEYTNKDIETMKAAGCKFLYLTDAQYKAFTDADREVMMAYWNKELKRLGIADPAAAIKRAYDMAAAIPGATN